MNVHVANAGAITLPPLRKFADPKLEKSDGLVIDGVWYCFIRRDSDGLTLRSMDARGIDRRLTRQEFWELYYARRLTIHRRAVGNVDPVVAKLLQKPLASFPKDDVDEAMRRLFFVEYAERLYASGKISLNKLGYAKAARGASWLWRREKAAEQGVAARQLPLDEPSFATVKDWRLRYISSGRQLVALVPAHSEKGSCGSRLDGRVEAIIDEVVRARFLTREEIPRAHVHDEICARVMQLNDTLPREAQVDEPHYNTLQAWIARNFTDFDVMLARKGREAALAKMKQVNRGPVGSWPMHTIQMDYVRLNMMAVTQKGDPLYGSVAQSRPWLVVALCTLTDMIVGWFITFEAPCWQSAMACLRHAVLPKDLSAYPQIMSDYPCMGGFHIVMMDNEKAFRSMSLKVAVASLRASVKWGPAGQPGRRGKIERAIRTMNTDLTAFVPGKTFSNVRERGDYDSERMAAFTIDEINARVARWVVDIYHNRPRGHFGLTPLQKWEKFGGAVSVLDSAADLDALLAISVQRTIQREGIRIFGLRYNHPALQKLINRSGGKGREYAIKVNPADLGDILVYDDMDEKWLYVPSTTPELAEGVDVETRRREMALARKLNGGNSPARRHLLQAREDLHREAAAKGARPRTYTQETVIEFFQAQVDDPLYEMMEERLPKRRKRPGGSTARIPELASAAGGVPMTDETPLDPEDLDDERNWR